MKLQVPFIQLPLEFDAAAMAAEISALGEEAWRPHPQGYAGNSGLPLLAVGGDPDDDRTAGAMQPTPYLQSCPYTQQVLTSFGAVLGRTRFMRLDGNAEVTPHVDNNYYWRERVRVHVPVVTTPGVRFECGDAAVHMAAGECWIFDTWRLHRVLNAAQTRRIHLVADTVGGDAFWQLVARGRQPGQASSWAAQRVEPDESAPCDFVTEACNRPEVMTPWEMRDTLAFVFADAVPHPALAQVQGLAAAFARNWHALWSQHGDSDRGKPAFRAEAQRFGDALTPFKGACKLRNGVDLVVSIRSLALMPAVMDADLSHEPTEVREDPARTASAHVPSTDSRDPAFDRPVFVVCAPRSGSTMLFQALEQAPGLYTIGRENYAVLEGGIAALHPRTRGFDSNRLNADDATDAVVAELRARYFSELRDRDGRAPEGGRVRMMDKTPKNALRVPFLAKVFPEARFVYLHREPQQVLSSMIEAWQSGRFGTYPGLPDWPGLPWSLLLVPGWRELKGLPVEDIVAAQWNRTLSILLDDLEALPRGRVEIVQYDALWQSPQPTLAALCERLGLGWDRDLGGGLPLSRNTVTPPAPEKWQRHASQIDAIWLKVEATARRVADFCAT